MVVCISSYKQTLPVVSPEQEQGWAISVARVYLSAVCVYVDACKSAVHLCSAVCVPLCLYCMSLFGRVRWECVHNLTAAGAVWGNHSSLPLASWERRYLQVKTRFCFPFTNTNPFTYKKNQTEKKKGCFVKDRDFHN